MKLISLLQFTILFFGLISCKNVSKISINENNPNIPAKRISAEANVILEKRVDSVLKTLTIKDKIAQLHGIWLRKLLVDGKLSIEKCKELIPHGAGHVSQFSSSVNLNPDELKVVVNQLQDYFKTQTHSKIPAIFHEEAITGFAARGATTFPQQIGMSCTWNPELLEKNTIATRKLMRQMGATQALSPMLDICRDARWGRIEESFGEEPYLTARMGLAFVKGLQGGDLTTGVAATTKHFAGYAGGHNSKKQFFEETLFPHEVMVRVGNVKNAMAGYHAVDSIPCSANKNLLTEILRDRWSFEGTVVADYWSVKQVHSRYGYAKDSLDAAIKSLRAGLDIELPSPYAFVNLDKAIAEKNYTEAELDRSVRRLLRLKLQLGLFDASEIEMPLKLNFDPVENRKLAYESAVQSVVLLKNNGVLPFNVKKLQNVAVVGPNADAVQSLLGDYTYQSLSAYWWKYPTDPKNPKLITLLGGLKNRLPTTVAINYERGVDWTKSMATETKSDDPNIGDERAKDIEYLNIKDMEVPNAENAYKIASESDVVIAAMGEQLYLSGENRNRQDVRLPGEQEAFVQELIKQGKPVILVIFGGRPQIVTNIEKGCAAILQAWYPGEEGGNAIADILIGAKNPSGKLTTTLTKKSEDYPIWYGEGYPNPEKVMYPFGYGLSYTTFEYTNISAPAEVNLKDEFFEVSFDLKNTGNREGTEIVQLYAISDEISKYNPIALKAFDRITLQPNESKSISFKLATDQFSYFEKGNFMLTPTTFKIAIGGSSTNLLKSNSINLKGEKKEMINRKNYFSHR